MAGVAPICIDVCPMDVLSFSQKPSTKAMRGRSLPVSS
jgi:NAD-dependent dihydropyrimidine dehydrogenase PreA subunit